jgi:hypothetical protein
VPCPPASVSSAISWQVAVDGAEIRTGINFAEAETLRIGFADAMARVGALV